MQQLVILKNPYVEKQCSYHSSDLIGLAACRGCRGTECENGITSEVLVELQNGIKDRFGDNIFDNIFSL